MANRRVIASFATATNPTTTKGMKRTKFSILSKRGSHVRLRAKTMTPRLLKLIKENGRVLK